MDHPNENMAQTNAPQEVVLRYEAPVTPIVERYVQPTPLPGRKNAPPSPSRRRKGLKIFLFCMLGLIVLSGAITALWYGGVFDRYTSYACPTPTRSSSATAKRTARS